MNELANLKELATAQGIKFHPAIGLHKLRAKLMNGKEELSQVPPENKIVLSSEDIIKQRFIDRKKEANRLIRIRVTCMNPNKKNWPGEIISVGSSKMGTFKKYVPYSATEGYHVPMIIYNVMKTRKFTQFSLKKDKNGVEINETTLANEFSIEVLDALTPSEIESIAKRQLAGG